MHKKKLKRYKNRVLMQIMKWECGPGELELSIRLGYAKYAGHPFLELPTRKLKLVGNHLIRSLRNKMESDEIIDKRDLKDGAYYAGRSNGDYKVARWDAKTNLFWFMRYRWDDTFKQEMRHPEDDGVVDIFYPIELSEPKEYEIIQDTLH
jgi:hypothetical protein